MISRGLSTHGLVLVLLARVVVVRAVRRERDGGEAGEQHCEKNAFHVDSLAWSDTPMQQPHARAGLIALRHGIDAERKPLEEIAPPRH